MSNRLNFDNLWVVWIHKSHSSVQWKLSPNSYSKRKVDDKVHSPLKGKPEKKHVASLFVCFFPTCFSTLSGTLELWAWCSLIWSCYVIQQSFFFLPIPHTRRKSLCLDLFVHPLCLSIFCTQYLLFCSADAINTPPLSGRYSRWHICYQQCLSGQEHKKLLRTQLKLVTNWVANFTLWVKKNKYKIVTFLSILLRSEIHDPEFKFNFYSSTSK